MPRYPLKPRRPVLQRSHPLARGLVLALPLWERGGLGPKDLACTVTGTVSGATWTRGSIGPGLDFAGGTNGVNLQDLSTWDFGSGNFTLSAWVSLTNGASGAQMILARDNDGTPFYSLQTNGGNARLQYRDTAGNLLTVSSPENINDGLPHRITGVRRGLTAELYVDGRLRATGTAGAMGDTNAGTALWLGRRAASGLPFIGQVYEARIHSRALPGGLIRWQHCDPWSLYTPGWLTGRRSAIPFLAAVTGGKVPPALLYSGWYRGAL
jgi:hypothetical protein